MSICICCGDSGGRAGLLTKPYKIEQVPGPFSCRIEQQHLDFGVVRFGSGFWYPCSKARSKYDSSSP